MVNYILYRRYWDPINERTFIEDEPGYIRWERADKTPDNLHAIAVWARWMTLTDEGVLIIQEEPW